MLYLTLLHFGDMIKIVDGITGPFKLQRTAHVSVAETTRKALRVNLKFLAFHIDRKVMVGSGPLVGKMDIQK